MPRLPSRLIAEAGLTRRALLIYTVVSACLNGLVTASVGKWLAHSYTTAQTQRTSIDGLASLLYERRTRAGLVVSSLRRCAELDELRHRKQAYDEAYVDWNKHVRQNLFAIRDVMGASAFSSLEQDFEAFLVEPLSKMDGCLTRAYDLRLSGKDPLVELDACTMADLYQLTLDCGASFTNELRKLTGIAVLPFTGPNDTERAAARARIGKACNKPAG